MLVNTSRGGAIVEDALVEAIDSGYIAAAALVFQQEYQSWITPCFGAIRDVILSPTPSATTSRRAQPAQMAFDNTLAPEPLKVDQHPESSRPGGGGWRCSTNVVKTFGLTLNLQDDAEKIAAYRRFHQTVWPEVTARLRACGVHRMQIFLRGPRLFMYLTTDDEFDPARDFARINEDATSARWNALMADLQARIPKRMRTSGGGDGNRCSTSIGRSIADDDVLEAVDAAGVVGPQLASWPRAGGST